MRRGASHRPALDLVMWPDRAWPALAGEWRLAEEWGIRRGWMWDHLGLAGRPVWHDAWTVLAAAAASTREIGLGTMVTSPNFRHPVSTAKQALALDAVSQGRFVLGVGAGGPGDDSDALGEGPWTGQERAERFAEWLTHAAALVGTPEVDLRGRWFTARRVALGGGAPRRVPLAVAATGPRGMGLAVAHGGIWVTQDLRGRSASVEAEVERQLSELDDQCSLLGRDPATLARTMVLGYGEERPLDSIEAFRDVVGRYAARGFDSIAVLWPRGPEAAQRLAVLEQAAHEQAEDRGGGGDALAARGPHVASELQ